MEKLQPVRGTHDLLPDDLRRHRFVTDTAREWTERYGYAELATPVFEFTEVFQRTLGETTDVVTKEMYTFVDRGGDSITLRPEFTAGIVRALISNGLAQQLPLKFFCTGPVFRHERPQKGRMRQFHQINVEVFGVADPGADVEVIALGQDILAALGVAPQVQLEINSLGDSDSRTAYRDVLVDYFTANAPDLSDDSKTRLIKNPLRILDSKDPDDRKLVADAPKFADSLNAESQDFFAAVRAGLDALGIAYTVNDRLVRGFDYYSDTAFEFTTTALGAQGTVIGGGRYDGLVGVMGGPATPAVGWGGGVERLALLLAAALQPHHPVAIVPVGERGEALAPKIARDLRSHGHRVELGFSGSLAKRMKRADKVGARAAVLLGDDEIAKGIATVRDLAHGTQTEVPLDRLVDALQVYLQ